MDEMTHKIGEVYPALSNILNGRSYISISAFFLF